MLLDACAQVAGAARSGAARARPLPWDPSEGAERKAASCQKLLAAHNGQVGVSAVEPLPDALVTVALLMLLPASDFDELLSEEEGGRVPLLDSSALEGEPLLAAACVEAIVAAVSTAEKRYPSPSSSEAPSDAGAEGTRVLSARAAMARALCDAELGALQATRQAAMRLLVRIGLGEEEEGEEEDDEEGEEEDDDDLEDDEEEGEDDDDEEEAPAAKRSKREA